MNGSIFAFQVAFVFESRNMDWENNTNFVLPDIDEKHGTYLLGIVDK